MRHALSMGVEIREGVEYLEWFEPLGDSNLLVISCRMSLEYLSSTETSILKGLASPSRHYQRRADRMIAI